MSHTLDASPNDNHTLAGSAVTHVGQMFFDQDLIKAVDAVEPYASNSQELTENADDSILGEEAADVDPMVEYVLLGDDISEGLFGWLAFGIDSGASYNVTPAATLTEDGGVANENAGMGMGGGAPPSGSGAPPSGSGTPPLGSGAIPSGTAPTDFTVGSTLTTSATPSSFISAYTDVPSAVSDAHLKASPSIPQPGVPQPGVPQSGVPQSGVPQPDKHNDDHMPPHQHNPTNKGPQQEPSPSFPAHA
jgi:hypothetical protein